MEGRLSSFRMHVDCEKLTKDWTEDEWEFCDPAYFRRLLNTPERMLV